ncbi:MAG: hypothetical protein ACTILG_10460, partial [Sphingobacterium sp.]
YRIFSDFGNYLIGKIRPLYSNERIAGVDIAGEVFALDSTTISFRLKLFNGVPGKYSRGAAATGTKTFLLISEKHATTTLRRIDRNLFTYCSACPTALYRFLFRNYFRFIEPNSKQAVII